MSFKDRNTRLFFEGERVRAFRKFADQAVRRLTLLDRTDALDDLAVLPGNRLEALPGERTTHGFWELMRIARWHVEGDAFDRALAVVVRGPGPEPTMIEPSWIKTEPRSGSRRNHQCAPFVSKSAGRDALRPTNRYASPVAVDTPRAAPSCRASLSLPSERPHW